MKEADFSERKMCTEAQRKLSSNILIQAIIIIRRNGLSF